LETHIFTTRIPPGSPLDGRTLAESRLGSALYLTVVALQRKGSLMLAPRPTDVLQAEDTLIVHGRPDHLQRFHGSQHLQVVLAGTVDHLVAQRLRVAEGRVAEGSPLLGLTLERAACDASTGCMCWRCTARRSEAIRRCAAAPLAAGDRLLMEGEPDALEAVARQGFVTNCAS
jgi:Trk K+ transport system NAD-binding subunit